MSTTIIPDFTTRPVLRGDLTELVAYMQEQYARLQGDADKAGDVEDANFYQAEAYAYHDILSRLTTRQCTDCHVYEGDITVVARLVETCQRQPERRARLGLPRRGRDGMSTRRMDLTAEDMADLIAGHTINAMVEGGEEIIVAAPDGVNKDWNSDLPDGYRWANAEETEAYGINPAAFPSMMVVIRTTDASGKPYTEGEADLALPATRLVPDFALQLTGEYQGNAYPDQREYEVRLAHDPTDGVQMLVTDSGGAPVAEPLVITEEMVDGIDRHGPHRPRARCLRGRLDAARRAWAGR